MSEKPHILWSDTATTGGTSVPCVYDGKGSVITYFPGTTEHMVLQECIAMHERLTRLGAELERLRVAVEAARGLELIAAERLKQLPGMRVTQWADNDSTARCEACNSDIVDATGLSEENAIARIAHRDGCPVMAASTALVAFRSALEGNFVPSTQPGDQGEVL